MAANARLVEAVIKLAADKGCTASQLALAWVLHLLIFDYQRTKWLPSQRP